MPPDHRRRMRLCPADKHARDLAGFRLGLARNTSDNRVWLAYQDNISTIQEIDNEWIVFEWVPIPGDAAAHHSRHAIWFDLATAPQEGRDALNPPTSPGVLDGLEDD